jgi:hypothetical protein
MPPLSGLANPSLDEDSIPVFQESQCRSVRMQQHAPSLLWITLHDIDVAHPGAFSLYIDGIHRTDRLCAEL